MNPPILIPNFKMCSGMIDQGRMIGGDPVGHSCYQTATKTWWIDGIGFPVCAACFDLLEQKSERICLAGWKGEPGNG